MSAHVRITKSVLDRTILYRLYCDCAAIAHFAAPNSHACPGTHIALERFDRRRSSMGLRPRYSQLHQLKVLRSMPQQISPKVQSPPHKSPAVFSVKELTKTYRMGSVDVHALRGIDLDLYAGEFIVTLGPSGSGKSTLLNILGGLDTPSTGLVKYHDHDLSHADDDELTRFRREHVGFVFQFYNLVAGLTARENITIVTDIALNPFEADTALQIVDLEDRANHYPAQLSGGEQQRVAIARAIAKRPEILLCDEPTGALDIKTGIVVLEAISRINRELGTLVVVITHNSSIAGMGDRVISLADGQISDIKVNAQRIPAKELAW